jgi:hypothetical protein
MKRKTRDIWLIGLAAAVLALGGLVFWLSAKGDRIDPLEAPGDRVARQIETQIGPGAVLRYAEPGQRRGMCGYVGRTRKGEAVAFVSTPNRILFSDDPMPTEFRQMRERYCPGFLTARPRR